jgi:hypothetical protein
MSPMQMSDSDAVSESLGNSERRFLFPLVEGEVSSAEESLARLLLPVLSSDDELLEVVEV